jgi:hypothetical protein
MPVVSIVVGGLLIALGVWGYVASDARSVTALIPAFVGAALAMLGALALKASLLKHCMHAAAAIGLLGFLAAAGRFVPKLIRAGFDTEDAATLSTGGMTLLCAVFVALCVNSFVQARRRRAAAAVSPSSGPAS